MAKGQQRQGIGGPSQSPDLNPTENVWAELKKRVRARRPTNLTQLHQLCQENWAKSLWKAILNVLPNSN